MYINENFTETQSPVSNCTAWDELRPAVQKLIQKCWGSTMCNPLTSCRIMQEDAKGQRLIDLIDAERYLIAE